MYNGNKLFVANEDCIKIVPLKLAQKLNSVDLDHKMVWEVQDKMVSTLEIRDGEKVFKIFGLALTSDGLRTAKNSEDFIHVMIEYENKITINKLVIADGDLPPYEFKYQFIEIREYIPRFGIWKNDPVEKYKFIINNDNV